MLIFMKTLTEKVFTLEADLYETMGDLKTKVQALYGIPTDDIRFVFAGRNIHDEKTLAYYNICEESIVHIVFRRHHSL